MTDLASLLPGRFGHLVRQLGAFGVVGVIGLLVDMAVVWLCLRGAGLNPYAARAVSFLVAATTTWVLNRAFTFRGARPEAAHRQWAKFLAANAVGGAVNYGVYAALVSGVGFFAAVPEAAVAVGSFAGLGFNFTASRTLVFRGA